MRCAVGGAEERAKLPTISIARGDGTRWWASGTLRFAHGADGHLKRQSHIILRQRRRRRLRVHQIVQLGELNPRAEFALVGEFVQHRGHPPGKAHRLPDPRQRLCRIAVDPGGGFLVVIFAERAPTDNARRWRRDSAPWRPSAARCGRRRRPETAGRTASARRRNCATARCFFRSRGR